MIQKLLLNEMDDTYKSIEENYRNKKQKVLIVFDDMIADMLYNKRINPIVTELVVIGRKLLFCCIKNIRLNSAYYFVMKLPNNRELEQIVFNHSSDIDFQDFMNLYKKYTAKPYFCQLWYYSWIR